MLFKNLGKVYPEQIIVSYIFKGDKNKIDLYFTNYEYLRTLDEIKNKRKLVKFVENYLTNKNKTGIMLKWIFNGVDNNIIEEAVKLTIQKL